MWDRVSTVKFGQRKINCTSGFLKDSVPKVGFRLMAFARAIGLREHENYNHMIVIANRLCSRTVTNMKLNNILC